jgi:hypothetical protein
VQGAGDDHFLAGLAEGQAERLVAVGGPGHGEPAPVGPPQRGRPGLRIGQQVVRVLDGVQRAVQRRVARYHGADQIQPLLMPGRGHRRQLPGLNPCHPVEPGGQQRGVRRQAERVTRIPRVEWILRVSSARDHLSSVRPRSSCGHNGAVEQHLATTGLSDGTEIAHQSFSGAG